MASLKSEDYGFLARTLYTFFRPTIIKIVASTDNEFDDKALAVLDKLLK